jgi:hypothetical protein
MADRGLIPPAMSAEIDKLETEVAEIRAMLEAAVLLADRYRSERDHSRADLAKLRSLIADRVADGPSVQDAIAKALEGARSQMGIGSPLREQITKAQRRLA